MNTTDTINALRKFQVYSKIDTFYKLFGDQALHLWAKFYITYAYKAVDFFHSLDEQNQKIMLKYLENLNQKS